MRESQTPRSLDYYGMKARVLSKMSQLEFSHHGDITLRQRERMDARILELKWVINVLEEESNVELSGISNS